MKLLIGLVAVALIVCVAYIVSRSKKLSAQRRAEARDVRSLLTPLLRPALHLVPKAAARSHLGGLPPAAANFRWPENGGKPLAFLASLDLEELAAAQPVDWLPDRGRLLFFYDAEEQPWGYDPRHAGAWRVILQQGAATGEAQPPQGLNANAIFDRRSVEFRRVEAPPPGDHAALEPFGFSEEEYELLDEYREEIFLGDSPRHQVLGYPESVQSSEMALDCQLASNGVDCGDGSAYQDARNEALKAGVDDWSLLLQLDTDDDLKWSWGDAGMIYFWIRRQDAQDLAFDRAWLCLQCA